MMYGRLRAALTPAACKRAARLNTVSTLLQIGTDLCSPALIALQKLA